MENYLLDGDALASSRYNNLGLPPAEIERSMTDRAGRLCWWAACRDVLAELKRRFRLGFIADPGQSIVDEMAARQHICGSSWFQKLATEVACSTEADIHTLLAEAHAVSTTRLGDGTWRDEFSGKEILRDVSSRFCHRPAIPSFPAKDAEFYADLAKDVAAWQVANGKQPADLVDLLTALKSRIARA
jgi:hypothetical protein